MNLIGPSFVDSLFGNAEDIRCCKTCIYSLTRKRRPTIAIANGLDYPEIPPEIEGLNKIEERLIAVRHVFQSIYSINGN